MSEIISILNQKGGVGKTTTAVNLSAILAEKGKKVLLIDMDAQANATTSFGFGKTDFEFNIFHILKEFKSISDVVLETEVKNLLLIPSSIGLVAIEKEFYTLKQKNFETIFKKKLEEIKTSFDFIIIDCPPAIGPISINALTASNSVIIPIQCEFFALEGLAQILDTIKLLQKTINPNLTIKGFLPTMFTKGSNLSKQIFNDLAIHFSNKLFKSKKDNNYLVIPRNIKLAEAPGFGKPISLYNRKSKGFLAYNNLADILLEIF
jgi:chromosome partitioning protein